jgi:hypothetical protein
MYYYCEGPIRGNCGHKHRKYEKAKECLDADKKTCIEHYGYSDRVIRCSDENQLSFGDIKDGT